MWFKQVQLFELAEILPNKSTLEEKLSTLTFESCPPFLFESLGWVAPLDEEGAPLAHGINNFLMLCLQVEEKILPGGVVRHALQEKVKEISRIKSTPVRQKEKLALKDEIIRQLLPNAFSKHTRVYAIVDITKKLLILNTANEKKTEQFLRIFKKTIHEEINAIKPQKLSSLMTQWLKYPENLIVFAIEKAAAFYDPQQKNRTIRCQHQDLLNTNVQAFLKEGLEVKQLALSWEDQINFVLSEKGFVQSIQYQEKLTSQMADLEIETKQQQFDADFMIMAGTLFELVKDLLPLYGENTEAEKSVVKQPETIIA